MRHPSKFLTTDSDSEWSIYHVDTKFVKLSVIITEIIEMLTCLQFLARAISDFVSEGVNSIIRSFRAVIYKLFSFILLCTNYKFYDVVWLITTYDINMK